MIILGVDTSCEQASCALYIDGDVSERKTEEDKRKHSQTVMPMVAEFIKEAGITARDIDVFAVSSGPGSFTGLRIGMAAIKGMAYALDKKIVLVNTLDVLANYFSKDAGTVCPVINARNNQVYTAIYEWGKTGYAPATEYMGIKVEKLAVMLEQYGEVSFCGDASLMHYEFFKSMGIRSPKPGQSHVYPSAGVLVRMAAGGYGEAVAPGEAVPFYLRVSQAERFRENGKM